MMSLRKEAHMTQLLPHQQFFHNPSEDEIYHDTWSSSTFKWVSDVDEIRSPYDGQFTRRTLTMYLRTQVNFDPLAYSKDDVWNRAHQQLSQALFSPLKTALAGVHHAVHNRDAKLALSILEDIQKQIP